jgi:polyhydroxyalkanoate synthesis regulator phasin
MIVSQAPNPVKSLRTRACTLVCALVVLPFGVTNAQDYDAVEKRLGKAVAKGEIDLAQAQVMMQALRQSHSRDSEARRMREGVEHRINEITKLVEGGKMSSEEGKRLTETTRRALDTATDRDGDGRRLREGVEHRINEIKKLVEGGKMSPEEGKRLIETTRRSLDTATDRDADGRRKRYAEVQRRIESAVREDKLSPETRRSD